MRRLALAAAALAVLAATPALAALKEGSKAPDFTAQGYQAGKPITFSLGRGPQEGVRWCSYFFPAAETAGCNLEARLFAEATDDFKKQGATVIGVTAGNLDKLASFSADTEKCSGKFPVAADPSAKIAASYDATLAVKPGWSSRTSYVIAPQRRDHPRLFRHEGQRPRQPSTMTAVKAWKTSHLEEDVGGSHSSSWRWTDREAVRVGGPRVSKAPPVLPLRGDPPSSQGEGKDQVSESLALTALFPYLRASSRKVALQPERERVGKLPGRRA